MHLARKWTTPIPPIVTYHKVIVTVTDVDEDGSISLSAQQPQVSVELTAALTDQDDTDTDTATPLPNTKWKWEQGTSANGPWIVIVGATAEAETPVAGIVGKYLRATATYTDKHGDDKSAMAVSAHAVRAVPSGVNPPPAFMPTVVDRNVDENSPPGTNVGKPVTAADTPGDILTYTLAVADESNYKINPATGQITVAPRTILDREADADVTHSVEVTATDPAGLPTDPAATVTIAIKNVNEAPTVIGGATRVSYAENTVTAGAEVVGMMTYTASDVEDDMPILSLSGADMGDFDINTDGMLTFKTSPNFESPADSNGDNVYMVTVVATDSGTPKLTATRDVVITVTNAEDAGEVVLSSVQPKVGFDFTASLTDEDGGVKDVKWQWASADRVQANDCPAAAAPNAIWTNIANAKSNTYRPVAEDATDNKCLQATATYTDSQGSDKSAMEVSDNEVVVDQDNRAPVFRVGGVATGKVITSDTRSIAENSDSTVNVGGPVTATDPNGTTNILTYTLDGSDNSSFAITNNTNGQITVVDGTNLNYEGKKVYKVTVTATDPSQASATIDITINVTDENESPDIAGDEEVVREFRENSASTVHTFRATDPEGRPVYWSLSEASDSNNEDVADFSISSTGALTFNDPPDFDNPIDNGSNNSYKVVVLASDDAPGVGTPIMSSMKNVTIDVTNVGEQGSISVDSRHPQVDVDIEATLTDGDSTTSEIDAATWQWYSGNDVISGALGKTYTPTAVGTLKVVATYVARGATRTAEKTGISVRAVPTQTNNNPVFSNSTEARVVDENERAGTNVGATIVAIDSDSGDRATLTYTLSPDTFFSIDDRSGQLKTKTPLNHETNAAPSVTVTATDPSGGTGTVTVTVTVNDVNEAPAFSSSNGGPTRAPNYAENTATSEMVATYAASDVDEGDTLMWSLTGTDASDFDISEDGVLTFKEMPDYENPAASNNVYQVTVTVSDGKLSATRPMTVTVTDVAEDGMVTISSVQPKVVVELTASLEDSDGGVKDVSWQWARSPSVGGTFTIIDGATSATYTPVAGDVTMFLRAMASYTDSRGEQTAMKVSDNPVSINNDNRAPMFPDTETGSIMRTVLEGTVVDTDQDTGNIGVPVVATDPNIDNLTYTLSGTDAASFDITRTSGQLITKAVLDYETRNTYMVTVTATDPNGLSDSIDVTIKVTDMDEAPKILVGGLAIRGLSSVSYAENGMGDVATYGAVGMDAASARWSLEGPDAGDFMISGGGVLTFRSAPDYEMPADADANNTYMVTVKADNDMYMAIRAVTIRVTDVDDAMLLISGLSNVDYDENGAGAVATYMATGRPNAASAMWSLEGPDAGDFMISGDGVLTFENSPDYEMPADADANNTYMVTVKASAGTDMDILEVTVTVTDVSEMAPEMSLLEMYDENDDNRIDKNEVLAAVEDFIFNQTITREMVLEVVELYIFG